MPIHRYPHPPIRGIGQRVGQPVGLGAEQPRGRARQLAGISELVQIVGAVRVGGQHGVPGSLQAHDDGRRVGRPHEIHGNPAHPATLGWLGAIHGHRTRALGVEHFGQTGSIAELYRHYGIDANAIVAAAETIAPGRPIRYLKALP